MADGHPFIWHELVTPDQASSGIIESLSAAQRELWAQACGLWEQSRGWTEVYLRQGKEWTMVSVTGLPKPSTSWPQGGTG